ncbi:MAG: FtsQ-type POTRA domain-containing protein [Oscillospiraceae bacterium]|nr:FtsQ-type POTRA domain-containing protein [Oscillospiraceae bacterium]
MANSTDKRYRSRRKRSRGKAYTVVAAVIIIAAAVLAVTVFFRVSSINVHGGERYSAEEISRASGIKKGGSLVLADTDAAARAVYDAFPYIQSVRVQRHIPGQVEITVVESEESAVAELAGAYWMVGTNGRVLSQASRQDKDNYISLVGLDIASAREGEHLEFADEEITTLQEVSGLLAALYDNGMSNMVYAADFTDSRDIILQFRDKYTVLFGAPEDMDYKVRYIIEIIEYLEEIDEMRPGTIDLSGGSEAHFIPDKNQ